MTYSFTLHCRLCGREYTPSREDIRRGPSTYWRCPSCRQTRRAEALARSLAAADRMLAELEAEDEKGRMVG